MGKSLYKMGVKLGEMIASMAGVTNVVQEGAQSGPKCNFVQTHTTRRSAATNLAMQGVPLDFIARLGAGIIWIC